MRAGTIVSVVLVIGLTGWFWLRGERFIAANGPTFDEGAHLTAGHAYWSTGNFHLNPEHPPLLKLLWALPSILGSAPSFPIERAGSSDNHWEIANAWLYRDGASPRKLFEEARRVNLAIGCGVVLLAGWCAYRLGNSRLAAVATVGFACSDPTLLALSCILSTDVGLAFFGLLTCYLMWEYAAAPSRGLLAAVGVTLGLMLASKFSALGMVAGLGAAGLLYLIRGGALTLPGKQGERGLRPAVELAFRLGVIAIAAVAVTYAVIHFDQWGKGLKFQLTRGAHGDGVMYLNGELSRKGWYYYFIETVALKLPLGLLLATVIGASLGMIKSTISKRTVWLIVPPVVFFALASYSRIDMGIRVVLPVLPFLYLLAGGLVSRSANRLKCSRSGSRQTSESSIGSLATSATKHVTTSTRCCRPLRFALLAGCLAWCICVAERSSPHELSYLNELAEVVAPGSPPLADSNVDWGQGLPALNAWMVEAHIDRIYLAYFGTDHPEVYGIRYQRLPGYGQLDGVGNETIPRNAPRHVVAVSFNHLWGLFLNDPDLYRFLRGRTPVTAIDGSIYVFDLTHDSDALTRLWALSEK